MSRLDNHVLRVQNQLTLTALLRSIAWGILWFSVAMLLVVLVCKAMVWEVPRARTVFWSGLGLTVLVSAALALRRRPSRHQAAVAIDERLELKEKFSTALYVRPSADPFAAAAVRDAERTAETVNLHDKFTVRYPRHGTVALAALVVALAATKLPAFDLFGSEERAKKAAQHEREQVAAQDAVKKVLAEIAQAPPEVQSDEKIQAAKREFDALLRKPIKEPARAKSTALKALQDVDSVKQKIKEASTFAKAEQDMKMFRNMQGPKDETGPVGKAHKEITQGKFTEAIENLSAAVAKFDQMDKKEQEKAAEQMKQMANQLQQMANDPKVQQDIQKQLQQMGANQQQAANMAKQMQQAANGDKQAQQQLAQQANQMMQQMNNGQGPNQQQQQQLKQMMNQMQQQANAQQNAANMAQAAAQMGAAMQQQAGQQQGQGGQQPGQQGQQQQQGAQAMNQGQRAMQNAIQQMQAQNQAAQAAAAQQGQQPGQQGQGQGQQANQGQGQGQGQGNNNNPNPQQGNGGQGGFAQATGPRPKGEESPFSFTPDVAPSQVDEKGKILASSFVKAASERGESKAELQEVIQREYNESTDEVEQDRIPAQAQKAVKDYFDSVKAGE